MAVISAGEVSAASAFTFVSEPLIVHLFLATSLLDAPLPPDLFRQCVPVIRDYLPLSLKLSVCVAHSAGVCTADLLPSEIL